MLSRAGSAGRACACLRYCLCFVFQPSHFFARLAGVVGLSRDVTSENAEILVGLAGCRQLLGEIVRKITLEVCGGAECVRILVALYVDGDESQRSLFEWLRSS